MLFYVSKCYGNLIHVKTIFTDKALWNWLHTVCDAAAVQSITDGCFFLQLVSFALHYTVPHLQNLQSMLWKNIKSPEEIVPCSWHLDPCEVCKGDLQMICLNQMHHSECSFICPVVSRLKHVEYIKNVICILYQYRKHQWIIMGSVSLIPMLHQSAVWVPVGGAYGAMIDQGKFDFSRYEDCGLY